MTAPAKPNEIDEKGIASGIIVEIKGRIKSFKKVQPENGNDFVSTLIVRPAKDAYSHPTTFSVNSSTRIGAEATDIAVKCELRPYVRKRKGEDYYNVSLWVIE
jgi:hypothetical protein